jgi:NADPH-dependent glutamate synthase beta subunit-like oxidoreductase
MSHREHGDAIIATCGRLCGWDGDVAAAVERLRTDKRSGLSENVNTWIPQPTDRHADVIGSRVTGAQLAALAIEHGLITVKDASGQPTANDQVP